MDIQPSIESLNKLTAVAGKFLGPNVKVIFEFGARYAEDTVEFAKRYPEAQVFTFECNPKTIPVCREKVKTYRNITLLESAVGDYDGTISFYPMNEVETKTTWEDGNQGASSLFKASGKYPIEKYVQDQIDVPICKLSTVMQQYALPAIDIMWMDVQGAELLALKGLEEKIKNVNIIHTEVEFFEIYSGQPLFKEIKAFLLRNGFRFYGFSNKSEYSGDAIFINEKIINQSTSNKLNWALQQLKNKLLLRG